MKFLQCSPLSIILFTLLHCGPTRAKSPSEFNDLMALVPGLYDKQVEGYPTPVEPTRTDDRSFLFPQRERDNVKRFLIPQHSPPKPTATPLSTFTELLEALLRGAPVRYHATLSACSTAQSQGSVSAFSQHVGLVEAYEYFNYTVLTMPPHVGFSWSAPQVDWQGVQSVLTEVRAYEDGLVTVRVTFLSGDLRQFLGMVSYDCSMSPSGQTGPSVVFTADDVTLTPIPSYDALRKALQAGHEVHSTSYYGLCDIQKAAIGGAVISEVKLYPDRITSSSQNTITNYQGPGYVYDIVTTTFWSNGSVISVASDRDVVTFAPYYVEQIDCGVIGGDAVSFVQIGESSA